MTGEWDVQNRWDCSPDWSWFGGYAERVAAVWFKPVLAGDMSAEFMVSLKALAPRVPGRYRGYDLNMAICGDGHDPFSGYTFLATDRASVFLISATFWLSPLSFPRILIVYIILQQGEMLFGSKKSFVYFGKLIFQLLYSLRLRVVYLA